MERTICDMLRVKDKKDPQMFAYAIKEYAKSAKKNLPRLMKYAKEFGVEAELCQYKDLLGYMARHHEDLEETFTDEQKEIFEKFHVAKSETIEYRFGRVKPPKARSWQSRASAGDRQRLCDGGEKLGRVRKPRRSGYF